MKKLILVAMVAIGFAACNDAGNTESGVSTDTSSTGIGTNEATGAAGTPGDTTGYGRDTSMTGTGTATMYDSLAGRNTSSASAKDSLNSNSGTRRKPTDTTKRN
ncbi:MAG: hypothetical protein V4725_16100 [Bacteroidota bacterium]